MRLAQLPILRQHVGQAGGMGDQVPHGDAVFAPAAKLGDDLAGAIVEREQPALDQEQRPHRHNRLGNRRHEKDDVVANGGRGGVERLVAEDVRSCRAV